MACILNHMSPRTGRPKLDNPRTEIHRIRFSATEDADITAAAEHDQLPIAEWERGKLLSAAKRANREHRSRT